MAPPVAPVAYDLTLRAELLRWFIATRWGLCDSDYRFSYHGLVLHHGSGSVHKVVQG